MLAGRRHVIAAINRFCGRREARGFITCLIGETERREGSPFGAAFQMEDDGNLVLVDVDGFVGEGEAARSGSCGIIDRVDFDSGSGDIRGDEAFGRVVGS